MSGSRVIAACRVHGPNQLQVDSIPAPALPHDGVIVSIHYGGICGSDLHYASHGRNGDYEIHEPLILGHEISGVISSVGANAIGAPPLGTLVTVHPASPCPPPGAAEGNGFNRKQGARYLGSAASTPHTQGAFATQISTRIDQLRPLPRGLSLRRAALAEPMAVALHAVGQAGDVKGKHVLVSGAGPIGLLTIIAALHRGAAKVTVTDLSNHALGVALLVGAAAVVNILAEPQLPNGSIPVVFEAAGAPPALREALRVVADGGTIVQMGILPTGDLPLPMGNIIAREITVLGSWRFDVELDEALNVLHAHPEADAIITHEFELDDTEAAFARASDPHSSSKVLLRISN